MMILGSVRLSEQGGGLACNQLGTPGVSERGSISSKYVQ